MSERAPEDGASRILAGQVAHGRLDLREGPPVVAERVPLDSVDRDRLRRLRAPTELEGLVDELLGVAEPAGCEREQRSRGADLPELGGLPQLVSDAACGRELDLRRRDVPNLELRHEPDEVPIRHPLSVADPLRHVAELAPQRETLGDRVGGEEGACTAVERVRKRCGAPRAAGELHRL